jgi:2-dehydropantoate 2-reductase
MNLDTPTPHVAVLGAGGVGGVLAVLLTRAGYPTTVLAREATTAHLQSKGMRLDSERYGDLHAAPQAAATLDHPVDVLFVAVKATSLDAALERIPAERVRGALVVPLLNGVESPTVLRRRWPDAHVVGASIYVSASRPSPGVVEMHAPFARVEMAHGAAPREQVEALAARLEAAGLDTRLWEQETALLWTKLHFLAPLALACTHAQAPVGVVRDERRDDLVGVLHEVAAVAASLDVGLDSAAVLRGLDSLAPHNKPSMLRDREEGRALEVDAIGGCIVRAAARTGVDVPVTARLVADLEGVAPGVG